MNVTIGTSTVVVSCKFFEIFKSTYFLEHLRATLEIIGKDLKDLSREKCAYFKLFWSVFSRIRTKCREIMETGIIANTDTFRAVTFVLRIVKNLMIQRKLEIKNFQIKSSTTKTKRLSQQTIAFFYTRMMNFPNGDFSISTFTTMVLYKLSIDK